MEDSTLDAPAPGLRLTGGWLILSNRNFVNNPGGTSAANGVVVGGSGSDFVNIQRPGEASIELIDGFYSEEN